MPEVRHNVKLAVTWRILAELTRRHPGAFRILETHPCSGQYDCISLSATLGNEPFAQHLCDFHTPAQHFHPFHPLGTPKTRLEDLNWPDGNDYVQAYLCADDPKKTIEGIEQVLGFPNQSLAPTTSPAVLEIRTIGAALERFALSWERLDVRCGWFDSSYGANPTDWAMALPAVREGLTALPSGSKWKAAARIAARVWQIKVRDTPEDQWGVVLDLKTGTAHAQGEVVSLTRMYRDKGRRLAPLADWVAERVVR